MAKLIILREIYKNKKLIVYLAVGFAVIQMFLVFFLVAIIGAMFGTIPYTETGSYQAGGATETAMQEIPTEYIDIFRSAGREYQIPWTALAACAKHDNDFGRGENDGFFTLDEQIIKLYGIDGNFDGEIDKNNARDAVYTLANLLSQKGFTESPRKALFNIYKSQSIVDDISETAQKYTDTILPNIYGKWPLPVSFTYVSSPYGYRIHPVRNKRIFHEGIDIPADIGTPVYPSSSGTVTYTGWRGGYGEMVVVAHATHTETRYAHLSEILVENGQRVTREDIIGSVGSTGISTGPHLHFEIRINGKPIDPEPWLR